MTGEEAWRILSSNIDELFRYRTEIYPIMKKPYTAKELEAQVMAFEALRSLDEKKEGEEDAGCK